jgi:hypothetical protein
MIEKRWLLRMNRGVTRSTGNQQFLRGVNGPTTGFYMTTKEGGKHWCRSLDCTYTVYD